MINHIHTPLGQAIEWGMSGLQETFWRCKCLQMLRRDVWFIVYCSYPQFSCKNSFFLQVRTVFDLENEQIQVVLECHCICENYCFNEIQY